MANNVLFLVWEHPRSNSDNWWDLVGIYADESTARVSYDVLKIVNAKTHVYDFEQWEIDTPRSGRKIL